ncbi:type I restriction enzyme HsdR N-terminal domain-containing protein [Brevundimonas sp.]|uniref:type I restriction enzyme HsdR N-terminal domain-containing protein n=1 Tax=Brevundimonas sp. TaxID=1871086 RepID=UPI0028B0CCDF|nr:type I restriction enzyme HsdR N-terminal domain-containing protein [Brevundimonas sp.]
MAKLPKKFTDRVRARLKHFQTIAVSQRARDVSEADTVTLVKDILAEVFGYDKYAELTSEHQIRGTFCDLAVEMDGAIRFLIEVKSAGSTLSDAHLRQAVNYGAHKGIEWIVLTNAVEWRFYRVRFAQPIGWDEVVSICLPDLSTRSEDDLQKLFLLAREGLAADAITAFHQQGQLFNAFTVAHAALSEPVITSIRRELRRAFPELKIDAEAVEEMMRLHVIKRELVDGEKADEVRTKLRKAVQKVQRAARRAAQVEEVDEPADA